MASSDRWNLAAGLPPIRGPAHGHAHVRGSDAQVAEPPSDSLGQLLVDIARRWRLAGDDPLPAGLEHERVAFTQAEPLSELLRQRELPHFRVRLAHITYVDNEEDKDPPTKYAFLIEHKDDLAARTGWKILEIPIVPPEYFEQDDLNVAWVFQFLIGNTDVSLFQAAPGETECCHNAKALGSMAGPVYSVPYDFDMSGIINTRYSEVDERLGIRNVRERLFRGTCVPPDRLARTIQVFKEQKDAVYALYMEQLQLDEKVREKTIDYLDDFYEIINNDRRVEREIVRRCRRT